jgi:SAM-dependent methyltransferase
MAFAVAVTLAVGAGGVLACSRASSARSSPQPDLPATEPPAAFHGRIPAEPMGYGGADWLERSDRETSEEPEKVLDALGITPAMQVADVGAGTGYFSIRIARRLGPQGRVFATDISDEMLGRLRADVTDAGADLAARVLPILCTETNTGLPAGSIDLELLVDVYHELAHPEATLQQLRTALRPGGRMALVEYRGDDPNVGIKPEHAMTAAQVRTEIEGSGFHLLREHDFLPKQRIFEFQPNEP